MSKTPGFYSLKKSKKQGIARAKPKSFSLYSIKPDMKESYMPEQRAQGIRVLTDLSYETYPDFMGGIKWDLANPIMKMMPISHSETVNMTTRWMNMGTKLLSKYCQFCGKRLTYKDTIEGCCKACSLVVQKWKK